MFVTIQFGVCIFPILPKINKIYKIIILPGVLYDSETWSFTVREERSMKLLENMVLWQVLKIRTEVTGDWRKLHNEELHNLYHVHTLLLLSNN
jgi:hypothetical protein